MRLNEYETHDARRGIGGYVDRYHHRSHSGLNYRPPDGEVAIFMRSLVEKAG